MLQCADWVLTRLSSQMSVFPTELTLPQRMKISVAALHAWIVGLGSLLAAFTAIRAPTGPSSSPLNMHWSIINVMVSNSLYKSRNASLEGAWSTSLRCRFRLSRNSSPQQSLSCNVHELKHLFFQMCCTYVDRGFSVCPYQYLLRQWCSVRTAVTALCHQHV